MVDAIVAGNRDAIFEELGDVLFQILFIAALYIEKGELDLGSVIQHNIAKMERRHPHVFGSETITDAENVKHRWNQIKQAEKPNGREASILDSIPSGTIVVVAFTRNNDVPQNLSPENSKNITVDIKPAEIAVAALDNAPPRIVSTDAECSRAIARSDSLYSITIRANDPEGDQVTYTLISGPAGMTSGFAASFIP